MSLKALLTRRRKNYGRDEVVDMLAKSDDPPALLRKLLRKGYNPNAKDQGFSVLFPASFTLLHIIAYCDDLNAKLARSCIPILVEAGVPLEARTHHHRVTALFYAVNGGRYEATDELLKAGADPDAWQRVTWRRIMHRPQDQPETVERLLQTGVDPSPPIPERDRRRGRRKLSKRVEMVVKRYERLRQEGSEMQGTEVKHF